MSCWGLGSHPHLCVRWEVARRASRKDLQQLIGKVQHIAKCVRSARRFMTQILAALRAACHRHAMPPDIHLDIEWFRRYAAEANGLILLRGDDSLTWAIECDSFLQGEVAFSQYAFYSARYCPPTAGQGTQQRSAGCTHTAQARPGTCPGRCTKQAIR